MPHEEDTYSSVNSLFKLCSWHNMQKLQKWILCRIFPWG